MTLGGPCIWLCPVLASFITLVTVFVSVWASPDGDREWAQSVAKARKVTDPIVPLYTETGREYYRLWSLAWWGVAFVFSTLAFWQKRRRKDFTSPILPLAHAIFHIYVLIMAFVNLSLLLANTREAVWLNPGYGMYGWSDALPHFPTFQNIPGFDLVHLMLALIASFCSALCGARRRSIPQLGRFQVGTASVALRLFWGIVLVMSFWYVIYDSKHQFLGSHLANAFGEYLTPYMGLSAIFEWLHERAMGHSGQEGPGQGCGSQLTATRFEAWLDYHQAAMLLVSISKFLIATVLIDHRTWEAPAYYEQSKDTDWYKIIVVGGLNFTGSVLLFIISEATRTSGAIFAGASSVGRDSTRELELVELTSIPMYEGQTLDSPPEAS